MISSSHRSTQLNVFRFVQWAEITDKSLIHEHKLRCVFLAGRDAIPEESGAGDVSRFEDSVSHPYRVSMRCNRKLIEYS
jgi:hypothetical protein